MFSRNGLYILRRKNVPNNVQGNLLNLLYNACCPCELLPLAPSCQLLTIHHANSTSLPNKTAEDFLCYFSFSTFCKRYNWRDFCGLFQFWVSDVKLVLSMDLLIMGRILQEMTSNNIREDITILLERYLSNKTRKNKKKRSKKK